MDDEHDDDEVRELRALFMSGEMDMMRRQVELEERRTIRLEEGWTATRGEVDDDETLAALRAFAPTNWWDG
jgi:hypothetical protein